MIKLPLVIALFLGIGCAVDPGRHDPSPSTITDDLAGYPVWQKFDCAVQCVRSPVVANPTIQDTIKSRVCDPDSAAAKLEVSDPNPCVDPKVTPNDWVVNPNAGGVTCTPTGIEC